VHKRTQLVFKRFDHPKRQRRVTPALACAVRDVAATLQHRYETQADDFAATGLFEQLL
jgi:hypothetical protein